LLIRHEVADFPARVTKQGEQSGPPATAVGGKGDDLPGRQRSEPNASESRFGLVKPIGGDQPATEGEVCYRRRSNEQKHPSDHPGWLGRARSERSSRNLGYPAQCRRPGKRLRVCAVAPSRRVRQNGRERKRASAAPRSLRTPATWVGNS